MKIRQMSAYERMVYEIQAGRVPSEESVEFMDIYISELERVEPDRSNWTALELTMASHLEREGVKS